MPGSLTARHGRSYGFQQFSTSPLGDSADGKLDKTGYERDLKSIRYNVNESQAAACTMFRKSVRRIFCIIAVALMVLPILVLHCFSFLFSLHNRSMRAFSSRMLTDSSGLKLRLYERVETGAEWNIVYIHGTPASAAVFGEQFTHPHAGSELIAVDRPGFGASTPALRYPHLKDQVGAIGLVITNMRPGRTILVGHSYGAPVALLAALTFTNSVAGVVLIGGSVDPAQERIYRIQRIANWPLVSWLLPRPLRQCNRELLTLRDDLLQLRPQLGKLNIPIVMLHGENDRQVPVANVAYLQRELEAAGKPGLLFPMVIPRFNHFIPWEHPESVEAALSLVVDQTIAWPSNSLKGSTRRNDQ